MQRHTINESVDKHHWPFKLNIIGLKRRNEHSYKTMILKDGIKQITKYCD